jgi:hypothetical protein
MTRVVVVLLEGSEMKDGGVAKDTRNFEHLVQRYILKAKQPEHVFINLFVEKNRNHLMAMLMLAKHRAKIRIMNRVRVRAKTMSRLQRSSTVLRIQGV